MKRYYIEDVKCGLTDAGMASNVVCTVKYNDGEESRWLYLVEVLGIPNFFLLDKDVFKDLVAENSNDEDFNDFIQAHQISAFDGVELSEDYYYTFSCFIDDGENPAIELIRYLIALVRCKMGEVDKLVAMGKGKYVDELDIPMSDVEEEFLKDL